MRGLTEARSRARRAGTIGRAIGVRLRSPAPPPLAAIDLATAARALAAVGARVAEVRVDAGREPWTETGLEARAGAPVSWLAHGDSWIGTRRGPHLGPGLQLRLRTGRRAPSLCGTGPTHTAAALNDGPIEICSLFPAELQGPDERLVLDGMPRSIYRGGFDVAVAIWPEGADVAALLAEAAGADPTGLCAQEAARIRDPAEAPAGWHAHPQLPLAGIHRSGGGGIAALARGGVEIIRRQTRSPLTRGLELRWRWRLDELPSALAEDTLLTHDYLSVAVEFSDGQDLTYYWSSTLPEGTSYRCPLPHWRHRETHLVVRSGAPGLGEWHRERRGLAADHAAAIGGPLPAEVVGVWLIATTVAQGGEGRGTYADIELADGASSVRVL